MRVSGGNPTRGLCQVLDGNGDILGEMEANQVAENTMRRVTISRASCS